MQPNLNWYELYEQDTYTHATLQSKTIKVLACTVAHMTKDDLHNHLLQRLKETAVEEWGYLADDNLLQSNVANGQIGYRQLTTNDQLYSVPPLPLLRFRYTAGLRRIQKLYQTTYLCS